MPVVLSAIGAGLGALIVVLAGELMSSRAVVGDTETTERWFVDHAARMRSVRRVVAAFDRHVWGGAIVGFALVGVVAGGASVGWILSTIDDGSGFARFDGSVAEWGSENATSLSTSTLRGITVLGDSVLLVVVALAVGALAAWRRPGTGGVGMNWSPLGFLLTVVVGVSLINNGLKWLVARDRPEVEHLVGSGGSSFPSGHSAAAAACWAAVALVVTRRARLGTRQFAAAAAVAAAVLVGASRVMLGVHWLTDAVAGLIVGWTWFFVVALIFGGRLQRFGEPAERVEAAVPIDHDLDAHDRQRSRTGGAR